MSASISSPTFEMYQNEDINDELLKEAAQFFSENYGVWGPLACENMGSFAQQGTYAITTDQESGIAHSTTKRETDSRERQNAQTAMSGDQFSKQACSGQDRWPTRRPCACKSMGPRRSKVLLDLPAGG